MCNLKSNKFSTLFSSFLLFIFFIWAALPLSAQTSVIDCNSDLYLLNSQVSKGKNSEAIMLSNDMLQNSACRNKLADSIFYLRGMAFYQKQLFDSAIINFQNVHKPDTLVTKSQFFSSLNLVFNNQYSNSLLQLEKINTSSSLLKELNAVQKSGNYLLMRDFKGFTQQKEAFSYSQFTLLNEERKIMEAYDLLQDKHLKSPAKAAWLSVIIPGAGKWYSNSRGKAVAAFLTVAVLSSITAEQAVHRGWKHYATWSAAGVTGLFYMGNIYGSYYQAKQYNKKLEHEIDENIRYNMHVSLRNVYY